MKLHENQRTLARLRCLTECVGCIANSCQLPESLCYVAAKLAFKIKPGVQYTGKFVLHSQPSKSSSKATDQLPLPCTASWTFYASGEEYCNGDGQWIKLLQYSTTGKQEDIVTLKDDAWLLLFDNQTTSSGVPEQPILLQESSDTSQQSGLGTIVKLHRWEDVVEYNYSLKLSSFAEVASASPDAVKRLRDVPSSWVLDHDEELAKFLCDHTRNDNEYLGSVRNYVDSIQVSSFCDDDPVKGLTDGDSETFWESDGSQGQHWIRLTMKKGIIVKKLFLTVDASDDNYMPYHIIVMGGELDNMKRLHDIHLDLSFTGDVCVLENMTDYYHIIEIRIKECKDGGIDTRIHGIKIKSSTEHDVGLSQDLFCSNNLMRYPKLENCDKEFLYRRALVLQRFIILFDSVLHYIVPQWQYSIGTFKCFELVRQLLPLSRKRLSLIETFLRETESSIPRHMPKLYINRCLAAEHRMDPSLDPEYKQTIFSQVYEGLRPRERIEKSLDYRWPSRYDQWWECKFASEGIIDQGGGFRDSLADIADELCPTDSEVPVPLPFFIRAPNQFNIDLNVDRDVYVPNSKHDKFAEYEWIGKLMGACLRSRESLVLSLPSFIWKKLVGESVSWSRDYITLDLAEVKLMENVESMDQEAFLSYFGDERTFVCTLCNGNTEPVTQGGEKKLLTYDNRLEYVQCVKDIRMSEFNKQVDAIKQGLLKVLPKAVLDLLTWQELEKKVCGDPDITVEALKKQTHYEDMSQTDIRVCHLWEAIEKFTSEDRSRFLRFVTGRRRLPAPIYICPDKGEEVVNSLPESSTCSSTLFLPKYESAKVAEDKLRYAIYNCIAIDTDMSPWDN